MPREGRQQALTPVDCWEQERTLRGQVSLKNEIYEGDDVDPVVESVSVPSTDKSVR